MSLVPLRVDLAAGVAHLRDVDPRFLPLIERYGPPPLVPTRNAFRSLARSIVYQQVSGKAAASVFARFRGLYPGRVFPRPADVLATRTARLQSAGLSRQKAAYLKDLAARFTDGTIPARRLTRLPEEELAERLLAVKGIGPWTVDMFLIFALNRPDVLPVGDLGVRRGFQRAFDLIESPSAEDMRAAAEPWRPYRTVATWYLWRWSENPAPDRSKRMGSGTNRAEHAGQGENRDRRHDDEEQEESDDRTAAGARAAFRTRVELA